MLGEMAAKKQTTLGGVAMTRTEAGAKLGISRQLVALRELRGIPLDAPVRAPMKKPRKCKKCGEHGHFAKTCGRAVRLVKVQADGMLLVNGVLMSIGEAALALGIGVETIRKRIREGKPLGGSSTPSSAP